MIVELEAHYNDDIINPIVKKVDHPNVHFTLVDDQMLWRTRNSEYYQRLIELTADLIKALPESKVKTITYQQEDRPNHGVPYGPVIPVKTFECDRFLRQNFENFIDFAKTKWARFLANEL